jgi:hypothetical protein
LGVAVALACGIVAIWSGPNFDDAQASTDRETVDCLARQLTPEDKRQLAQFADANDYASLWRVYDGIFPQCLVRGDQADRKAQLTAIAWRMLSKDPEFARLREANAVHNPNAR